MLNQLHYHAHNLFMYDILPLNGVFRKVLMNIMKNDDIY